MITVYLIVGIVFILTLLYQITEHDNLIEQILSVIFTTLVAWLFTILFVSIISNLYIKNHKSELTYYTSEVERTNIKTLSDNTNNVTGVFALGFGSINSKARFYFYVCESDSVFYLKNIKADDVKIIENDTVNPCIIKYEEHIDWSKSEISSWLFKLTDKTEYYSIYVPKNTIIKQYNLDAQ